MFITQKLLVGELKFINGSNYETANPSLIVLNKSLGSKGRRLEDGLQNISGHSEARNLYNNSP